MSRKRVRSSEYKSDSSDNDSDDNVLISDPGYSGPDDSGSDSDSDFEHEMSNITYKKACASYSEKQDKLEKDHEFIWIEGEKLHLDTCEDKVLLYESQKKKIRESEPFQWFETFFSIEMKKYMIDACINNSYDLKLQDLATFIGIVIFSTFNPRKSQRDYWSFDPYLSNEVISSAMSRQEFETIKCKLKYSKNKDKDPNDRGWRVRSLLKLFQSNIIKFGIWRTALSIDEMMVRSYAKTVLKQFIRGKPIRFGLKFWGLCTSYGYPLNLNLYCCKNSQIGNVLTFAQISFFVITF